MINNNRSSTEKGVGGGGGKGKGKCNSGGRIKSVGGGRRKG